MLRSKQPHLDDQHRGRGRGSLAVSAPGFLLVDGDLNPIYVNDEAVRILTYPPSLTATRSINQPLLQRIRSVFAEGRGAPNPYRLASVESGKRQYLCRFFSMSRSAARKHEPAVALLLERNARPIDLLEKADEFHLTRREREAVHLLAQGLTRKEIAMRMGISPNTAKAFLRLAMVKTGVSTPSGIIGRFLHGA